MAKSVGKPMVLLPNVVLARLQHAYALHHARSDELTPRDLNGKRVGIRSLTTTTGAWLRGILANDHGVDLESIDWVTFEDVVAISHLLVSKYMLTTACRVSKACSRAAGQSFPVYPLIADVERSVEVAGSAVGDMLDMMISQAQRSSPPYYWR